MSQKNDEVFLLLGVGASTGHAEFGKANFVGVVAVSENNFEIFSYSELLSISFFTNSSAAARLKCSGPSFSPDKSTSRFNVTSSRDIYAASRDSESRFRVR